MKVIAINGSPHPQGNTFHALKNIGEVENIKSLDPLLYSKLTHQKNIRIK